jgi:hypothetical protein
LAAARLPLSLYAWSRHLYFRDLGVSIVKSDDMPPHLPSIYLREAEHVVDIFLHFMPRKYTLDGMGKTNIVLGAIPGKPRYCQSIATNDFILDEFDRDAYQAASPEEKDKIVLAAIESSLLEIACDFNADPEPIRTAAARTRECNFELKRESKLSRSTKSRRLRLCVFQHLSREGIRWGIDLCNRQGTVLRTLMIDARSNSWDSAHDYRKSFWKGSDFVVVDFLDKETYRLNVAPLEAELVAE